MDSIKNYRQICLKSLLIEHENLPNPIFHKKFKKNLFFDADLRTCDELIDSLKIIVSECFGDVGAGIFSAYDNVYIGDLGQEDWGARLLMESERLESSGNYHGIIILGLNLKWIARQFIPVDVGILSIDSEKEIEQIKHGVIDSFFDCKHIGGMRLMNFNGDLGSVECSDKLFFEKLLSNYC